MDSGQGNRNPGSSKGAQGHSSTMQRIHPLSTQIQEVRNLGLVALGNLVLGKSMVLILSEVYVSYYCSAVHCVWDLDALEYVY